MERIYELNGEGYVCIKATPEYIASIFQETGHPILVIKGITNDYEFAGFSWNESSANFMTYFRHKKNYAEGITPVEFAPVFRSLDKKEEDKNATN